MEDVLWHYKHLPPYLDFYMGSGDRTLGPSCLQGKYITTDVIKC